MRKFFLAAAGLVLIVLLVISCSSLFSTRGDKYCQQAMRFEGHGNYPKALEYFNLARTAYRQEKNCCLGRECCAGYWRAQKVMLSYPHSLEAVRRLITQSYPKISQARIDQVIKDNRIDNLTMGGKKYYFADLLNTLYHLYPDFRASQQGTALGKGQDPLKLLLALLKQQAAGPADKTFFMPATYLASGRAVLKRAELPAAGTFKIWIPLPIATAAQDNIKIVAIEPAKYVKGPFLTSGDIGLAYLEVPLDTLKNDLKIEARYEFRHFAQRFKIDPAKVGSYDRNSQLYRRYTRSARNIIFDAGIRDTARKVVAGEKNPYLAAQKLYYYVVEQINYSFMPHLALEVLKVPESIYVHRHRFGDCGAQSIYFAALCRSLGIPARCPGGLQTFPIGQRGAGDHFWAEFYLPDYGWIPVDTSVGQLVRYYPGLSKSERQAYMAYFFGGQDNCRWQIQNDVDVPLTPEPAEPLFFAMALQAPTAVCDTMPESAGKLLGERWVWTAKKLNK
ncbi:MAG: transglutaminase-like domain-containing protein [Candidatus Margulisiibacteriota bacterium]